MAIPMNGSAVATPRNKYFPSAGTTLIDIAKSAMRTLYHQGDRNKIAINDPWGKLNFMLNVSACKLSSQERLVSALLIAWTGENGSIISEISSYGSS